MINAIGPVIGQWYRHLDKGETFQVIAADTGEGLVEVQFIDGDIEEIPREDALAALAARCRWRSKLQPNVTPRSGAPLAWRSSPAWQ
jgi:hypothetical protein